MTDRKVQDFINTGEFNIIDNWTHQFIEKLPRDRAIAKYGYCEVWASYTSGESKVPDGNGKTPSWKTDVWVEIPGMKIGYWNRTHNLHLRFCGDENEATFVGKKSGQKITVRKHGSDDYSVETCGITEHGTARQIIEKIKEEWCG